MQFNTDSRPASPGSSSTGVNLSELFGLSAINAAEVMPNKAGLKNSMALLRYEAMVTSVTIPAALARLQNSQSWGLRQIRLAHQIIFAPVYDWAGKLRTVNIRKQDRAFIDKNNIEVATAKVFKNFRESNAKTGNLISDLGQLPPDQFSQAFAGLYHELNLIHPFREGNGRTIKTVLTAMARQAGYDFKWNKIADKKWNFDEACKKAARHGKLDDLAGLFREVCEPVEAPGRASAQSPRRHTKELTSSLR